MKGFKSKRKPQEHPQEEDLVQYKAVQVQGYDLILTVSKGISPD